MEFPHPEQSCHHSRERNAQLCTPARHSHQKSSCEHHFPFGEATSVGRLLQETVWMQPEEDAHAPVEEPTEQETFHPEVGPGIHRRRWPGKSPPVTRCGWTGTDTATSHSA